MEVFNVSLLFLSSALDEAAAALTRMRAEPSVVETGRSLVAACSEGPPDCKCVDCKCVNCKCTNGVLKTSKTANVELQMKPTANY